MKRKEEKESTVRALDKALTILDHLSHIQEEIDLANLSRQVKIPKSTLLRLLNTLKKHNLIEQNERTQKYQLGWALIYLGKIASRYYTLPNLVHPFLDQLAAKTGETASLVVLDNSHAVYIDQAVSSSMIKGVPSVGSVVELHCTSAGKALLSAFTDEDLSHFVKVTPLDKKTEKTITNGAELIEEIRKARRLGYAIDDEETEVGGRCVAAPLFDQEGKAVAAISIIGPVSRIKKEDFGKLSILVKESAARASAALGYVSGTGNASR